LSSFWIVIKQKLTTKEISIFSNSSHFEWRAGLSDTILKGDHPRTIPAKFALIWFIGFRGEDLNVYQNMSNLYNRYKSFERKISQKNPEYLLNYSLPCSCTVKIWAHFDLYKSSNGLLKKFLFFSNSSHLEWRAGLSDTILKGTHPGTIPARFGLIWLGGFRGEDLNVKVYNVQRTDTKWWQKLTWPLARWAKNLITNR
jgi:hypothetical protein